MTGYILAQLSIHDPERPERDATVLVLCGFAP